ncbi:MAG: LysM peptidoglycan-binding domain-containing protein [Planctomycetes bacterium]|nr:LysM peptidoglycan-binding domain-containing protein [Planctomycetota bacterium]
MGLVKAQIKNLDTNEEIEVLFNPREYTIEKSTPWKEHDVQGLDGPAIEFTFGNRQVLSMELFFDTYEEKKDVREHTQKIADLLFVNAEKHRPPILLFTWGKNMQFKCLLERLSQKFTMFLDDGTPVRATLQVTFKEYTVPFEELQKNPRHSPDHTKRRIVKEGDTLQWIASKEYGDPGEWRMIADANGIDDPRKLEPGTELLIPPLT